MEKFALMEKDHGTMNVPLDKVSEYLKNGWTEISRVDQPSGKPAGKQAAAGDDGQPSLKERRKEYIDGLKAMSDEELVAHAIEKGLSDSDGENRKQLTNKLIEVWNEANQE